MSEHRHDAVWAVIERLAQQAPHEDHLADYDSVEDMFGPKRDTDPDARRLVARARLEKARTLAMLGRTDEAVALAEHLASELGSDPDPDVRRSVCRALFGKALEEGDADGTYLRIEAIAALAPPIPGLVAEAAVNRGALRERATPPRLEEAKRIYLELLDARADSEDFEVRHWVDDAAFGVCRIEFPALATDDDVAPVVARYADDADWRRQYLAAVAILVVGNRFLRRKADVEAAAMFERVHALFGAHPAATLRAVAVSALMNRGVALGRARGSEVELQVYDELFAGYGDAAEPIVRRWVAAAEWNAVLELRRKGATAAMRDRLERLLRVFEHDAGPAPLRRDVAAARQLLAKARR